MPEPKVIAEFNNCPWCGSTRRLGDHILNQAKMKGQVSPNLEWVPIQSQLNPPIDEKRPPLIGSSIPTAIISTDFCLGCGRSYVVKIVEAQAQIINVQRQAQTINAQRGKTT
ncbi:MAG: hypothetical protein PHU23_00260 [Dehalococcoidales bacterium]|nr:hypothetical protein [Dehalococcoidales bacterium]